MSRIDAVLFDAAGTLIELREPVGETYARIAANFGVRVEASRLSEAFARAHRQAPPMVFAGSEPARLAQQERAWWRRVVRDTFRRADPDAQFGEPGESGEPGGFDACFECLYETFARPDTWRPRAGALQILARLRARGLALAVLSNFDQRLHGILGGLGFNGFFDFVILPSDAAAAKPDPRIFAFALARLGVAPGAAVYVGDDHENDVEAARNAGLFAVDVSRHATLTELSDQLESIGSGADHQSERESQ
jgi:putative hydrolase of the HAD superfamily